MNYFPQGGIFVIITCISTSNVKNMKNNSVSTKVCGLINDIIKEKSKDEIKVNIIPLADYEFKPCIMCGECSDTGKCISDESFNEIYSRILESDGIFLVVPHYATIPSKLTMILEKIQEFCFIHYCKHNKSHFALYKKPVGIIAHGGQEISDEVLKYYKKALLDVVANSLTGVGMQIIGTNDDYPNGVIFGIKDMKEVEGKLLPNMVHDMNEIKERITPLINNMLLELESVKR